MALRICIISQYYPPDPGGASTRAQNLANALSESGHEVVVIAAQPHYPDGPRGEKLPGGYQERKGLEVFRTPIIPIPHSGIFRHLLLYSFFSVVAGWYALWKTKGVDVVWCVSPNYLSCLPGFVMKLARRSKVVLEVVDLWPEALMTSGYLHSTAFAALTRFFCNSLYRFSDTITTLTISMSNVIARSGVPESKIRILPNMVDSLVLAARNQKSQPPAYYKNHFVVIYSGNIGPIYDFDALVKTAGHLQTEPSVLMVIRGSGEVAPALRSELGRLGYSNILFLGSSSRAEALNHIAWADVCVLPLKDGLDNAASYPVKLIEYLAMGKPVIALADGPIRTWLVETQAGLALSPGDSKGLAREIIRLKTDPHLVSGLGSRASSASLEFLPARFRLGAIDVLDNLVREKACVA